MSDPTQPPASGGDPCPTSPPSLPAPDVGRVHRMVYYGDPFRVGFSGYDAPDGDRLLTQEGLDCIQRARAFLMRHPVTERTDAWDIKVTLQNLPEWGWTGVGAVITAAHLLGYPVRPHTPRMRRLGNPWGAFILPGKGG